MKELEDLTWFPPSLRNFQTEFIGFIVARFNVYATFVHHLNTLALPVQPMADLCSGSGQPAISIFRDSNCFSHLTLSDKYPNALPLNDEKIVYEIQSEDVLKMDFKHGKYYTMFNAFHHFTDKDKLKIVRKILASGSAAFLVEVLHPNIFCFLKVFFTTTLGSLLLTPFMLPFSLKRFLFTYLIPVNIITITFDGVISVLRSRSVKEYKKLFANYDHTIEVVGLKNGLSPLILISIRPNK